METRERPQVFKEDSSSSSRPSILSDDESLAAGRLEMESILSENSSHLDPGDLSLENSEIISQNSIPPSNSEKSPFKSSTDALSNDYLFKKPFNPDLKVLSPFTSRKKIIKNNFDKEYNPKRKVSVEFSNIFQDSFDEDLPQKNEIGRRVSVNFSLDNSESDGENNAKKPFCRRVSVQFPDNLNDESNASSLSLISEEEESILGQDKKENHRRSFKSNSKFPQKRVSVKFSLNDSDGEMSSSLSSSKTSDEIIKNQNSKTPEVDISQNSSTIGLSSPFRRSLRRSSTRVSSVFDDTGILDDSLLARIDNAITCNRTTQSNTSELVSFGKTSQNPVDRSSDADLSDLLTSTSSNRNIPFTPDEPVNSPEKESSTSEEIQADSSKSSLTKNLDVTELHGIESINPFEKDLFPHEIKRSRTSKSLRSSSKKSNVTKSLDFTDFNDEIESDTSSVISTQRSVKGAKTLAKRVSVKFSLNDTESETSPKKNSTQQKSMSILSENGRESNDENDDASLVKSTEKESLPEKAKQTHSLKSLRSSSKKSNLTNSLDVTEFDEIESDTSSVKSPQRSVKGVKSLAKRVSIKFSLNSTDSESDTSSKNNSTPQKSMSILSEKGTESNDENETKNDDAPLVKSTGKESLPEKQKQTHSSTSLRSSNKKSNLTDSMDVTEFDDIENDISSVISSQKSVKDAKSLAKRVSVKFSLNATDSESDTPSKKNFTPQKSMSVSSEKDSESKYENETMNNASLVKSTEKESLSEKALDLPQRKSCLKKSVEISEFDGIESDDSCLKSPQRPTRSKTSPAKRVSVKFSLNDNDTNSESDTPSKENSAPQKSMPISSENGSESNDENETVNGAPLVKSTEQEPLPEKAKQTLSSKSLRSFSKKANLTNSLDVTEFDEIGSDTSSVISLQRSVKGAKSLAKRVSVKFSLNDTDSEIETPSKKNSTPQKSMSILSEKGSESDYEKDSESETSSKKNSTPQKSMSILSEKGSESDYENETMNDVVKSTEKESLPEKEKQTHSSTSLRSSNKKSNLTNSLDFNDEIESDTSSVISLQRSVKGAKSLAKRVSVKFSLNDTDSESETSSKKNSTPQKSMSILSEKGSESDYENETMNDVVKSTEKESLPEKEKQTHSSTSLRSSNKKSNLTNSLDFNDEIESDTSSVISLQRSVKGAKSLAKRVSVKFSLNDTDSESNKPSKKNSIPQKSMSILSEKGSEGNDENETMNDAALVKSTEKESLSEKAVQAPSSKSLDLPQRNSCLKKSVEISEFDGIQSDDSCLISPQRPTRSKKSPAKRVSVKFSLNDTDSESVILSKKNSTRQKSLSVLSENGVANRDENKTDYDASSANSPEKGRQVHSLKSLEIPKRKSCLKRSLSQDFNLNNSEQLRNRSMGSDTRRLSVKFNDLDNDSKSSCLGKPSLSTISEDGISFTSESLNMSCSSGTNKPKRRLSVKFDLDDSDNEGNSSLNYSNVSTELNQQTDEPSCNLMTVQNSKTPEKNDGLSVSALSSPTPPRRNTRQSLARASSVFDDTKNIDDSLLAAMDSVLLKRKKFKKSLSTSLPNPSINTTSLATDDKSINVLADLTSHSEVIMDISVEAKNKKRAKSKKSLSTSLQNPIINTSSPVAHDKSINVVLTPDKTTYSEVIMDQSFPLNSENKNVKKSKKSLCSSLQKISEDANVSKSRFEISISSSRSSLKSDSKILNTFPDTSLKLDHLDLPNPLTFPTTDENSSNIVASPDKTSYSEVVMEQDISSDKENKNCRTSNISLSTSLQNPSMNTSVSNSRFDKSTSDYRTPLKSVSKISLDEAPQLDELQSSDLQIPLTSPSADNNVVLDKTSDSEVIIQQDVPSDNKSENASVSDCHVESADDKNIYVDDPEPRSPLKPLKHGSDVANLTPNKSYNLRKLSSSFNQLKEDSRQKRKTTNESLKLNEITKSKDIDVELSSNKITSSMTGNDLNVESEVRPLMIPSLSVTSNSKLGTGQVMPSSEESLKHSSDVANLTPNKSYNLRKLSSSLNQLKEDSHKKRKTTNESLKLHEIAKVIDMELSSNKITSSMTGKDLNVESEVCPLMIPSLSETSNSQLGTGQVMQSSEESLKHGSDVANLTPNKSYDLRKLSSSLNQLKEDSHKKRKTIDESFKLNEITKSKDIDVELSSNKITSSMTGKDLNVESEVCPLMIPSLSETSNSKLGTRQVMQSSEESLKHGSDVANLTPNKSYNLRKLSSSLNQLKEDSHKKRKTIDESFKLNEIAKGIDMELSSNKITTSSMTGNDLNVESEECPLMIPNLSETLNSQLGTGQVMQSSEESLKHGSDVANLTQNKSYNMRKLSSSFKKNRQKRKTTSESLILNEIAKSKDTDMEKGLNVESEVCPLLIPSLSATTNSQLGTGQLMQSSEEYISKIALDARNSLSEKPYNLRESSVFNESQNHKITKANNLKLTSPGSKIRLEPNVNESEVCSLNVPSQSELLASQGGSVNLTSSENKSSEDVGKLILETRREENENISSKSAIVSEKQASVDEIISDKTSDSNMSKNQDVPNKKRKRIISPSLQNKSDKMSVSRNQLDNSNTESRSSEKSILKTKSDASRHSRVSPIPSTSHISGPDNMSNSNNKKRESSSLSRRTNRSLRDDLSVPDHQNSVSIPRTSKEHDFVEPVEKVSTISSVKNNSDSAQSETTAIDSPRHSRHILQVPSASQTSLDHPSGTINNEVVNYNANEMSQKSSTLSLRISSGDLSVSEKQIDSVSKEQDFVEPDEEVPTRSSVTSILKNRSDFAKSKATIDSSRHSRRISPVPSTSRASKENDFVELDEKITTRSSVKSILKNISESSKSKTTIDSSRHSRRMSPVPSISRSPKKHNFVEPNTDCKVRKSSSDLPPSATSLNFSSQFENKKLRKSSVKSMLRNGSHTMDHDIGMPSNSSAPNFFIVPDIPFQKPSLKRSLIAKSGLSPKSKEQKTDHNSSYSSYLEEFNNNKRKHGVFHSTPKPSSHVEEFNNNQTKRGIYQRSPKPTSDVICQTSDQLLNVKKSTMNRYSSVQTDEAYSSHTFNQRKRLSSNVPFKQRVKFILSTNDSTGTSYRSSSMMSSLTSRRESSQESHFQHVRFRDRPSLIDKSNFENDSTSDESGIEPLGPERREPTIHGRRVSFRNRFSNVGSNSENSNDSLSRFSSQFVDENVSQASGITAYNSEHLTDIEELSPPLVTNHSPNDFVSAEILPIEPNSINNSTSFVNPMENSQVSELCLPDDFSILNRAKLKNIPSIDDTLINCDDLRYDSRFQQPKKDKFPDKWVSKKFIEYLTTKLRISCQSRASVEAQHLISLFCAAVKAVEILTDPTDIEATTLLLRKCLVKYNICPTSLEYYLLLWNYTPQKFRNKVFSQVKSKMGDPIV